MSLAISAPHFLPRSANRGDPCALDVNIPPGCGETHCIVVPGFGGVRLLAMEWGWLSGCANTGLRSVSWSPDRNFGPTTTTPVWRHHLPSDVASHQRAKFVDTDQLIEVTSVHSTCQHSSRLWLMYVSYQGYERG